MLATSDKRLWRDDSDLLQVPDTTPFTCRVLNLFQFDSGKTEDWFRWRTPLKTLFCPRSISFQWRFLRQVCTGWLLGNWDEEGQKKNTEMRKRKEVKPTMESQWNVVNTFSVFLHFCFYLSLLLSLHVCCCFLFFSFFFFLFLRTVIGCSYSKSISHIWLDNNHYSLTKRISFYEGMALGTVYVTIRWHRCHVRMLRVTRMLI